MRGIGDVKRFERVILWNDDVRIFILSNQTQEKGIS